MIKYVSACSVYMLQKQLLASVKNDIYVHVFAFSPTDLVKRSYWSQFAIKIQSNTLYDFMPTSRNMPISF